MALSESHTRVIGRGTQRTDMSDLRKTFWNEMERIAAEDENVILLTGDLGYSFFESFAEKFPKQFINAGIAEQNMLGVAAGLARVGKRPFVYSGAIFAVMRPYEFLRDDISYNNTNVVVVGTGAADFLGFTHVLGKEENIPKLLNGLPNLKQFYPEDEKELASALRQYGPSFVKI